LISESDSTTFSKGTPCLTVSDLQSTI
jgi:hypothetical protein